MGLLPPTSGRVRIRGLDVLAARDRIRTFVGYMPQHFSLYSDLTVAEILRVFAELYGLVRVEFGLEFSYVREHDAGSATYLDRGTYQLLITTLMQDLGQTGRAVIVGRASQVILADHPAACHVKIVAPFAQRIEVLMDAREMDRENAQKLAAQHDDWRKAYLRNAHNADWDDPLLYDLTINTGRVDADAAVDMIVNYMRSAD